MGKWRPRKPPQLVRWDLLGVFLSYLWGNLNSLPLPQSARSLVYRAWAYTFRVDLDEVPNPLESYSTLREFFSRSIREGIRPITTEGMASPVDGKVVIFGEISADRVEQVKGVTYPLSGFLGSFPTKLNPTKNTKLYHCVLYLSPGDYHRIHSPTEWRVERSRHFPGTLFPVSPPFGRLIPNLLALNERVALLGRWAGGYFSMTAVGAYSVGSISLLFDQSVRTNDVTRDWRCGNLRYFSMGGVGSQAYEREYEEGVEMGRGEEVGSFNLGSTVVLVFESEGFTFSVKSGERIRMGEKLGFVSK